MNNKIDPNADRSLQDEISIIMFERLFSLGYQVFHRYLNSFLLVIPGTTKRAILDFSCGAYSIELHDVNGVDKDEVFNLREDFLTSLTTVLDDEQEFIINRSYIEVEPVIN